MLRPRSESTLVSCERSLGRSPEAIVISKKCSGTSLSASFSTSRASACRLGLEPNAGRGKEPAKAIWFIELEIESGRRLIGRPVMTLPVGGLRVDGSPTLVPGATPRPGGGEGDGTW